MTDLGMSEHAIEIFFEIHRDNPREGPGCLEATRRAYKALANLRDEPIILDIGCGPGRQTLDLAALSGGRIYALDNYEPYLKNLQARLARKGLESRVFPRVGDMTALAFEPEYFDIIWAEGSIYLMGFENGLNSWRSFLRPDGYMALTEISWLKDKAPRELTDFWVAAYPAIQDQKGNIKIIEKTGYQLIDHFILPPEAWWDNYYSHIEKKMSHLKAKYKNDAEALEVIATEELEMDLYRKYHEYYGYVFYIMQNQQ
jgi:SAM-dependent methyltransferase